MQHLDGMKLCKQDLYVFFTNPNKLFWELNLLSEEISNGILADMVLQGMTGDDDLVRLDR